MKFLLKILILILFVTNAFAQLKQTHRAADQYFIREKIDSLHFKLSSINEIISDNKLKISANGNAIVLDGDVIVSGGLYGINIETLSADKTLNPDTDKMYQYLDPNGADRVITLATSTASTGDRFVIRQNGTYSASYNLQIKQGATILDYIYVGAIKKFIFDGTNWIPEENGTGENDAKSVNLTIGVGAIGYNNAIALGSYADAHKQGIAIGYTGLGYNNGVSVGYGADGYNYGAGVGAFSSSQDSGTGIGYASQSYNSGVAVGINARGFNNGLAVGYHAGYVLNSSLSPNKNILIGFQAGNSITTGNNNLIIGYDQDTPTATTSNFLNIGGVIYGDLSSGNIGIGTISSDVKLDVAGYIRSRQIISMDAIAWFPPSTNGADLDTLNSREEVYLFDQTTAETLFVKNYLPLWFTSLDSVEIWVSTSSSSGDSVAFELQYYGRTNEEAIGTALSNTQADTLDLGTSANIIKRMVFSDTFSNLSASDGVVWGLHRDPSISNNVAADVRLHRVNFYYH